MQTSPLEFAATAAVREASRVHLANMRGLGSLATIASTAAWLGFGATVFVFFISFQAAGNGPLQQQALGATEAFPRCLAPSALGISVALIAKFIGDYLRARSAEIDVEMKAAALVLVNELAHL
jgi:biopolymer transport protein ExbB/TolQ